MTKVRFELGTSWFASQPLSWCCIVAFFIDLQVCGDIIGAGQPFPILPKTKTPYFRQTDRQTHHYWLSFFNAQWSRVWLSVHLKVVSLSTVSFLPSHVQIQNLARAQFFSIQGQGQGLLNFHEHRQGATENCLLQVQSGIQPEGSEKNSAQPILQVFREPESATPWRQGGLLQVWQRGTKVRAQVTNGWADDFSGDGLLLQAHVRCITMTSSKGIEVIPSLVAFDPKDVYGGHFVGFLLKTGSWERKGFFF